MSDSSSIVVYSVIPSAAKDLTNSAFPALQKHADRSSGREVPHFVRDDRAFKTAQRTLQEHV